MLGDVEIGWRSVGNLEFVDVESCVDPAAAARMSFVHGVFRVESETTHTPVEVSPGFAFDDDLVLGAKYRGKTNERLTQLLINVGLAAVGRTEGVRLLDPMCGRGTTLSWAMQYGLEAVGIDAEPGVLADVERNLKRFAKVHRVSHSIDRHVMAPKRSATPEPGSWLDVTLGDSGFGIVVGDSRRVDRIPKALRKNPFDLVVTDLPYGVDHRTSEDARNPLDLVRDSLQSWRRVLAPGGVAVLAFNRYQPTRAALSAAFDDAGWRVADFAAEHRMSESIVRDVLVAHRPPVGSSPAVLDDVGGEAGPK